MSSVTNIALSIQVFLCWILNFLQTADGQTEETIIMTTENLPLPSSTKGYSGPGPDELVIVDYIIIGFTVLVVGGTIIGGIIFAYKKSKQSKKEKDELYAEYLQKTQYHGVKAGQTNKGYTNESPRQ